MHELKIYKTFIVIKISICPILFIGTKNITLFYTSVILALGFDYRFGHLVELVGGIHMQELMHCNTNLESSVY